MSIYVNRNNEKLGPFTEDVVLQNLKTGDFAPIDLAVREGETNWKPLGAMFPGAVPLQVIKGTGGSKSGSGKIITIAGILILIAVIALVAFYMR